LPGINRRDRFYQKADLSNDICHNDFDYQFYLVSFLSSAEKGFPAGGSRPIGFNMPKNIVKLKWYIIAIILVALVFFYFTAKNNKKEWRTVEVKRQDLVESVNGSGELEAQNSAELRFNIPSKVVWLKVKKGDQVNRWQAVASLDKKTLEKNLQKYLLDFSKERADFDEDLKVTYRDKVLTDTISRILAKNQYDLDKAVLDVEIADLAAKESVLVSPIAGTVISTGGLVAGENLTAANLATKYIKVSDLSTLRFKAQVDEVDYGKIRLGQPVNIVLDAFPSETFTGSVSFINQEGVKTLSGGVTIPIEISLDQPDERLVIGLSGEADFIIEQKQNVLAIPREFIKSRNGQTYVYVLKKNKPVLKEITAGLSTISLTEITAGLEENQTVVLVKNGQ